jgi:hypothetical protein
MEITKYEWIDDAFQLTMTVPFRNTLLEVVCGELEVSHDDVCIVELCGMAPKCLRSLGKEGKIILEECMTQLTEMSQSIADNGIVLDGKHFYLLMATSGAKQSASMLLSSDSKLVDYFDKLMTHPSKSTNQLRMGYQLPLTPNKGLVNGMIKLLIVPDQFDDYLVEAGSINQCVGVNTNGSAKWSEIKSWKREVISHFDTRQATSGVGDCHVKISVGMAEYLAEQVVGYDATTGSPKYFLDTVNQGCQFRLMINGIPAMAKGTFVVSSQVPEGYGMVIPASAFKLGVQNLPTLDGEYEITIGAVMPAVDGRARFGSQFARSMPKSILAIRKPVIAKAMAELNEAGHDIKAAAKYFNAEVNSSVTWFEETEDGKQIEQSRDDWFYKVMASIAKDDSLGWALKDPTITSRILSSVAKRKIKLALGLGFIGRVRTALPDDRLSLHVISAVDAPKLSFFGGEWIANGKIIPHNAVGMVECNGVQHVGMLVVRGKAPIMNHGEQSMGVLINNPDGAMGCEYMSHQSASLCTMDFDGDRNSSLIWSKEPGYLEAINHYVKLMRDYPLVPVAKDKSKVLLPWGELMGLVYESSFEKGCSSITSIYAKATDGKGSLFLSFSRLISETTAATQLWLDCQKYAPKDRGELNSIIDQAIKHYQGWQGDQRDWECDNIPYVHRTMFTSKTNKKSGVVTNDVGTIADVIRYVNSLHQAPKLAASVKPLSHLKGIWGDYAASDKELALEFKSSLKSFSSLCDQEDSKKIASFIDGARLNCQEFTPTQFSAFWDLYYTSDRLVEITKDGRRYCPTASMVWMLFSERIITTSPDFSSKKELIFFKDLDGSAITKRLSEGGFDTELEVVDSLVTFDEKRGSKDYLPVRSVKLDRIIGYIGTHVEAGVYGVSVSPYHKKSGEISQSCFNVRF